jgi:hypothetical protein
MSNAKSNPLDSPAAWFAVLDAARRRNDFERAAEAKRQLERLGVKVQFASGARKERRR